MKTIRFAFGILAALALVATGCTEPQEKPAEHTIAASGQPAYAMEDVAYIKTSAKPFDELVAAIETAATENKFTVLYKHNISETLGEKGLELPAYTIIEVCNGKYAHSILTDTKEAGMFLPCRIAVYDDNGTNTAAMMLPSLIGGMMPDSDFGTIPQDVEDILKAVIDAAVQ